MSVVKSKTETGIKNIFNPNPMSQTLNNMEKTDLRKVKVAWCKCGKSISLVSAMPHAEIDKDSIKEFTEFAKDGCKIQIITMHVFKQKPFLTCKCFEKKKKLAEKEKRLRAEQRRKDKEAKKLEADSVRY